MQTFLPYPDFAKSAAALDRARLGKQRLEAVEILCMTTGQSPCWLSPSTGVNVAAPALPGGARYRNHVNHPACRMWRDHPEALTEYYRVITEEWLSRGYKHTLGVPTRLTLRPLLPPWIGDKRIHVCHQANLVKKDPAYYSPQFPGVKPQTGYYWPR